VCVCVYVGEGGGWLNWQLTLVVFRIGHCRRLSRVYNALCFLIKEMMTLIIGSISFAISPRFM
jgi:hypothetical protein